jgi:acetylornithine deacetylase/succinyl-diaminopimelate desuccinylase-like protein
MHMDAAGLPAEPVAEETVAKLAAVVDAAMPESVAILAGLVAHPGIAWPGFDQLPLEESARNVQKLLHATGFPDAGIIRAADPAGSAAGTPAAPAVIAERPAGPGMPTVLLYAHHDVQPPGLLEEWLSDPFTLTERDGRLYARGAADDKAGILMHIAAVRALDQVLGPDHGLGLTVFIEGEEESGSRTLPALLGEYAPRLQADAAVVADSGSWRIGTPALTTSLRGLVDGTIEVRTLNHALHSGTYGGPLLDALSVLARLMATFHHDDGSVAVEGLASRETEGGSPDFDEDSFRRDAGAPPGIRLAGTGSIASRLWNKPALSFVGLDAPPIATAANTLLPAASVKFSVRLAPGSNPDEAMEAVRRHVQQHTPFGAEVTFTPGARSWPYAVGPDDPFAQMKLWALGEAWGATAVSMGVGGSIPFVAALSQRHPRCSILVTGAEDPDSRAHGANESVHLGELRNAILAEALFLAALCERRPPG